MFFSPLWELLLAYPIVTSSTVHVSLIALETVLCFGIFSLWDLGVISGTKLKVKESCKSPVTWKSYRDAWFMALTNSFLMIVTVAILMYLVTGSIHGGYGIQGIPREEFPLEAPSFLQWLLETLLLIILVDFGVYWGHRILHQGELYTWYHRVHHAYHDIICVHAICTHIVELYAVMSLLFIIPRLVYSTIGVHPLSAYTVTFLLTGHNIVSHSGYDDHLEDITFGLISGSKMHTVHHQKPKYNFGFYTYIWDYIFNTKLTYNTFVKEI